MQIHRCHPCSLGVDASLVRVARRNPVLLSCPPILALHAGVVFGRTVPSCSSNRAGQASFPEALLLNIPIFPSAWLPRRTSLSRLTRFGGQPIQSLTSVSNKSAALSECVYPKYSNANFGLSRLYALLSEPSRNLLPVSEKLDSISHARLISS